MFVPSRDQDRSDTMLVLVGCQYADGSRGCYRHITDGFALAICHTVATVLFISPTTANSLSAGTVNLCTALASHGACSHIAAIASTHIARLHNPSLSCAPASLPLFRPTLLEARIVRAPDPHQTIMPYGVRLQLGHGTRTSHILGINSGHRTASGYGPIYGGVRALTCRFLGRTGFLAERRIGLWSSKPPGEDSIVCRRRPFRLYV